MFTTFFGALFLAFACSFICGAHNRAQARVLPKQGAHKPGGPNEFRALGKTPHLFCSLNWKQFSGAPFIAAFVAGLQIEEQTAHMRCTILSCSVCSAHCDHGAPRKRSDETSKANGCRRKWAGRRDEERIKTHLAPCRTPRIQAQILISVPRVAVSAPPSL